MNKPRLLCVDDEDGIREVIKSIVEDRFEFVEACNGEEGLDILKHMKVDVILTDFNMPKLSGLELIRSLSEAADLVPIILLTGRGSQDLHRRALAHNVFDYIEKPFNSEDLLGVLDKSIHFEQLKNENNIFAQKYYKHMSLKLNPETFDVLYEMAKMNGLSIAGYLEKLIGDLKKKKSA